MIGDDTTATATGDNNSDILDLLQQYNSLSNNDDLMANIIKLIKNMTLSKKDLILINMYLYKTIGVVIISSFINKFINADFKLFNRLHGEDGEEEEDNYMQDSSNYNNIKELFHLLGWIIIYSNNVIATLVSMITAKVKSVCSGEYDTATLPILDSWLQNTIYRYIDELHSLNSARALLTNELEMFTGSSMEPTSYAQKKYLLNNTIKIITMVRSNEIFEMITEYPDSITALKELKDCVVSSNSLGMLGKTTRAILQRRLLHMGASTNQILYLYVSMVKALRIIDPTDLLLNFAAAPVRAYLKSRKDAVRCIVSNLTEGKDSELHGELKQGGSLEYAADEDDEDAGPGSNWMPNKRNKELIDPIASTETAEGGGVGGMDTLALLVSIYGSTDLFIVEYRSLLADRLLNNSKIGYSTDQEVANLELLKIRFGEETLHSCEVMLKDIEDSKRTNHAVHTKLSGTSSGDADDTIVDFTMISENYWPPLPELKETAGDGDSSLTYHPLLQNMLNEYLETYHLLKKPRKLHPSVHFGLVDVELEFASGVTRSFSVTPIQASAIAFFQADSANSSNDSEVAVSLRYISRQSGDLDEQELYSNGLQYWVNKGVISEIPNNNASNETQAPEYNAMGDLLGPDRFFKLIENQQSHATDESVEIDTDIDKELRMDSAAEAQQKALYIAIEGYVKGLLSSHGTMTLERLHTMLKMVAGNSMGGVSDVNYDLTIAQLRQFLQTLVDQFKVECIEGGIYTLPNSGSK